MPSVSSNAVESESAEEPSRSNAARSEEGRGIALAFAAFLIWGLFPIYFDLLRDVPPLVTLAFRAVFTSVLLLPLVLWRGKGPAILATLRRPKYVVGLSITMAATAASWGLFIWLIAVDRTLYCSLGNYISPLANVVFARFSCANGRVFFRLSRFFSRSSASRRSRSASVVSLGKASSSRRFSRFTRFFARRWTSTRRPR